MLNIVESVLAEVDSGKKIALATVTGARGSTPRSVGTWMAFGEAGGSYGTVGGGHVELQVSAAANEVLRSGFARKVVVNLDEEVNETSRAPCGGTMEVLVSAWGSELLPVAQALSSRAFSERRKTVIGTCLEPAERLGALVVLGDDLVAWAGLSQTEARMVAETTRAVHGIPGKDPATPTRLTVEAGGRPWTFLWELMLAPAAMVICGGGHIAVPLSRMASVLGFQVSVIDDRPTFATRDRFPACHRVVCGAFAEALSKCPMDQNTYVVVATHGHANDLVCLRHVLGRGAGYVGMVSSRRRVIGVLRLLQEEGAREEHLAELSSPAGLDIGAETPEEIALSILAEIVMKRRGGKGTPLRDPRPGV